MYYRLCVCPRVYNVREWCLLVHRVFALQNDLRSVRAILCYYHFIEWFSTSLTPINLKGCIIVFWAKHKLTNLNKSLIHNSGHVSLLRWKRTGGNQVEFTDKAAIRKVKFLAIRQTRSILQTERIGPFCRRGRGRSFM